MNRRFTALCAIVMVIVPSMTALAQAPGRVTLISPPHGSTDQPVNPTFKWYSEPTADDYRLIVSTDQGFTGQVFNDIVADTMYTLNGVLENGTQYWWNVRARNASGQGQITSWWSLTTMAGGPTQVSLTSPSNGATDVSVQPVLEWGSVSGAASYHLQVSTTSDFATTVVDNPSVGTTQFQPTLDPNQTYYWRVRASNAGEFNWSSVWSFTTGSGAPQKIVLTAPADGATGVSITPELSWESDPVATEYRVQISTSSDFNSIVVEVVVATTTWTSSSLVNATKYYWRVRGLSSAGNGPFSNSRSFTTEAGGSTQVQLASPADGATDIVLDPVLSWNAVSGGSPYRLQVSKASDFGTTVIDDSGVSGTSYDVDGLDPETTYYWRVLAASAPPANWSETWSFTTGTGLPAAIVLSTPADGATEVPISTSFTWEADPLAESYRIHVSLDPSFTPKEINQAGIVGTTFTPSETLNPGATYYWRVRGINTVGSGPFSEPRSFVTAVSAPGSVTLVSPANNSTNVSSTPTLSWEAEESSDTYDIQISLTQDFASPIVSSIGQTETEFVVSSALQFGTPYFWRVRGANTGGKGPWSTPFAFTTMAGGSLQVQLISPSNGATDVGLTPLLKWGAVPNAATYALQVSTQSNFSSTVINRDAVTSTQFQTSSLDGSMKYYWRVRASNAGVSNWSATWNFTTSSSTPDAVSLISPADHSGPLPVDVVLKWNQAQKADTYELQMTKVEDDYTTIWFEKSGIVGTEYALNGLTYGDIYWWRIRGENDSGSGPWSDSWGFLTMRGGELQPLILDPLPGATGVSLEPLLVWSSVPDVAGKTEEVTYHVQVATSFSFTAGTIVMEETATPDTTYQVSGLLPDTTYAWRVKASNSGPLNWTITASFVTGNGAPAKVQLQSPSNGAANVELSTDLTWEVPPRATSFNLQVALDPSFTSVIVSETGLSDVTHSLTGLDPNTNYYWRVQAVNQDGLGEWSDAWVFTTVGLAAPTAPVLISPLNGATEVGQSPLFTWNASETASSYKIEISTSPVFSTVAIAVVVTQPFYQADGLLLGQGYFWRVEARNAGGSATSEVWSFTTVQSTAAESDELPDAYVLDQNYPNPFNPSTAIEFSMPEGANALLVIYNVRGEEVARLVDGYKPAGRYKVVWDAGHLPSGVYLYRFQAGNFVSIKKLTLTK